VSCVSLLDLQDSGAASDAQPTADDVRPKDAKLGADVANASAVNEKTRPRFDKSDADVTELVREGAESPISVSQCDDFSSCDPVFSTPWFENSSRSLGQWCPRESMEELDPLQDVGEVTRPRRSPWSLKIAKGREDRDAPMRGLLVLHPEDAVVPTGAFDRDSCGRGEQPPKRASNQRNRRLNDEQRAGHGFLKILCLTP
jgi:hypothetical protein